MPSGGNCPPASHQRNTGVVESSAEYCAPDVTSPDIEHAPRPLASAAESGSQAATSPELGHAARPGQYANGDRPGRYLQSRCILCFGGKTGHDPSATVDVIACLDACFTQKRRSGLRDPQHIHPSSVFLSDAEVADMEATVERLRPSRPRPKQTLELPSDSSPHSRKGKRKKTETEVETDKCEGPLRVPNSVLDGCEASFKAADEEREKASTKFFDDTGLMAIMCRHDCVLWLANITTAGERQHYALALLHKYFQHIPTSYRVGVLYDIGCQLHRSCYKWGFLPEVRDRILFSISVFHAYNHQWPCQVAYHPRKCIGFGLSDGEGAERFWSSIEHLIPGQRVRGYWERLYVLNNQIHFDDMLHRRTLGEWILRKFLVCMERLGEALEGLKECGVPLAILRTEWASQQAAQTRPIPRQSKNAANKHIDAILKMDERVQILNIAIANLEAADEENDDNLVYMQDFEEERSRIQRRIHDAERKLDIRDREVLRRLYDDKYLRNRLNALALKTRIRDRLRQRKFEFRRIERALRLQSKERKLATHASVAIQRREPGIQALARRYNTLCSEMRKLIACGQAPSRAVPPDAIDLEKLWTLMLTTTSGTTPVYLMRTTWLRKSLPVGWQMRKSGMDQWAAVNVAREQATSEGMRHQLGLQRSEMLRLAVVWALRAGDVPSLDEWSDHWGPTSEEMSQARAEELTVSALHNPVSPTDWEDEHDDPDAVTDDDEHVVDADQDPEGHERESTAALFDILEDLHLNVPEVSEPDALTNPGFSAPSTPKTYISSPL
ncbi:hypothetical protein PUNSTDRAFT_138226 [Punctularia strigosozonata HHB-11173 SS5]|uniref:CxC1-like cysteine cluster associated with KDZ transposases domain-containing protein n=1 Tax=Punctularia strigosozonata (strain HHB-11173) TaxID=741275 RepID=R7S3S7_PUNST|nr:uncharacterized protein PUNSTDRAFT_138226 [Punctularia strigosozonata HHB-11173 SS5]EIN05045.1 hypothetical protein PUNSTDRAFT_138226 [Punctularia strigosozonata HHB-11173 SS5]